MYDLGQITVLIVEDNKPMIDLVHSILNTLGIRRIFKSYSGEEAISHFQQQDIDLVICDWLMKPMDGLQLVKKFREEDSPNRFVPIIMMTGYSARERVLKARDHGVNEFVAKPFAARDLYNKIQDVIEKPRRFVESEDFFGPDRRRSARDYEGPKRRITDHQIN